MIILYTTHLFDRECLYIYVFIFSHNNIYFKSNVFKSIVNLNISGQTEQLFADYIDVY